MAAVISASLVNSTILDSKLQNDAILPDAKIKIENFSKERAIFKLKLDFSKLSFSDMLHLDNYLRDLPEFIKCLDFLDCHFEGMHGVLFKNFSTALFGKTKIQKFKLSKHLSSGTPLNLTVLERQLLLLDQQLNLDVLSEKLLSEYLERGGDIVQLELIPEDIKKLTFNSEKQGVIFLWPWQVPGLHNNSSFQDLTALFGNIKTIIEKRFAHDKDSLSLFTGPKGLKCLDGGLRQEADADRSLHFEWKKPRENVSKTIENTKSKDAVVSLRPSMGYLK